ncbi:hypothetical protein [Mesorhizobium sp. M0998]|uniref:ABC transporter ATP-binding protein n=1 Tax=Mesorhizobium sp. M0998 TaxID=2957044 RepID=UPI00333E08C7
MNFAIAPDDALAAIARAVILDAHSSLPSVAASSTRWCSYLAEVLEQGAVRDIFHSPGHPYTRALLWCAPGGIKKRTRNLPRSRERSPACSEAKRDVSYARGVLTPSIAACTRRLARSRDAICSIEPGWLPHECTAECPERARPLPHGR